MTTTRTSLSIYHTPSSSLFENYESARASPVPSAPTSPRVVSDSPPVRHLETDNNRLHRVRSSRSDSSGSTSAVTITPSLFARQTATASTTPARALARGPALFFTSAKTGAGVADVFTYVANRVVRRWEWEELVEIETTMGQEVDEDEDEDDMPVKRSGKKKGKK